MSNTSIDTTPGTGVFVRHSRRHDRHPGKWSWLHLSEGRSIGVCESKCGVERLDAQRCDRVLAHVCRFQANNKAAKSWSWVLRRR
jgi:hypothetical protein